MKIEASKMSAVLLGEKTKQALALTKSNPYEAMTKALALAKKYPRDERAAALCLNVALKAKAESGKDVMTEDVYRLGKAAADLIWMSPTLSSLHVVSKALMGKPLTEEDITSVKRSIKMGPEVTSEIINDAKTA